MLSPSLFNLYVNDLVTHLNRDGNLALAYADDIVIYSDSRHALTRAVHSLDEWSVAHLIDVNKSKSAIMEVKAD